MIPVLQDGAARDGTQVGAGVAPSCRTSAAAAVAAMAHRIVVMAEEAVVVAVVAVRNGILSVHSERRRTAIPPRRRRSGTAEGTVTIRIVALTRVRGITIAIAHVVGLPVALVKATTNVLLVGFQALLLVNGLAVASQHDPAAVAGSHQQVRQDLLRDGISTHSHRRTDLYTHPQH